MRFLFGALLLLALIIAGAAWFLTDANRYKSDLTEYLSATVDQKIQIDGDLSWRWQNGLVINASNVSSEDEDSRIEIDALELTIAFADMFRAVSTWELTTGTMHTVKVTSEDSTTHFDHVRVQDYRPNEWAEIDLAGSQDTLQFALQGQFQHLDTEPVAVNFRNIELRSPPYQAFCEGRATLLETEDEPTQPPAEALLPIDILTSYNWQAECELPELTVADQKFENVRLHTHNQSASAITSFLLDDFFSGSATIDVEHLLSADQLTWRFKPTFDQVEAQPLMSWLGRPLEWEGKVAVTANIKAAGNTTDALISSVSGSVMFDGGEGILDIREIKRQVAAIARYTNEAQSVEDWPDDWNYKHFVGVWNIDGDNHVMDIALDNLSVQADGIYQLATDALNIDADLTFGDDPNFSQFDVNPLLVGLPLPANCSGTLAEAKCRLDESQAIKNVGRAVAGGEDTPLRAKLEEKIEEEVPEAYQDAARALLDILSGGLSSGSDE